MAPPLPFQQTHKIRQLAQNQKNQNLSQSNSSSLDILKDKPFWIWDKTEHLRLAKESNSNCCFQHIVKPPVDKTGRERPLWDYQKQIIDTLMLESLDKKDSFKNKHLYLLKSAGLGGSELCLRIMAWLCTRNDDYKNSQMVIVTGPNWDLSIKLMKRLKAIFEPKLNIIFQDKETVLNLNGCVLESFPSNHLDSFRSLTNPAFIMLDESDMFRKGEQEEVRFVSERYIAKSDPYIVLMSTPGSPLGLMSQIQKESEDTCIYRRLFMDYTYGIDKIYTREEIEKAKKSISFSREMDLQFQGFIGNTFHENDIQKAIELGNSYDSDLVSHDTQKVLGIDPGWGSSAFGLVLLEYINGQIQVRYAEEFERPRYEDMTSKILQILKGLNQWSLNQSELAATKIYIDAANPEFISSLKRAVNERHDWNYIQDKIKHCKKYNLKLGDYMTVIPVPFSTEGKNMLIHTKELLEYEKRPLIGINSRFDKLLVALRTAISDDQGHLDKSQTSFDNVLDAFRLSLRHFNIKQKVNQKPIIITHS